MLGQGDLRMLEEKARQGDAAAFGELIEEYDRDLRGAVWSIVQSSDATDDVMQASYEKAFRAIRSFDGRSALKTWLHRVCVRSAIDHERYEQRRRHVDIDAVATSGAFAKFTAAPSGTGRVDDELELGSLFADLDATQRALLMLTAGLGYSFDDAAVIMNMKRGTVASKVVRAKAALRAKGERR